MKICVSMMHHQNNSPHQKKKKVCPCIFPVIAQINSPSQSWTVSKNKHSRESKMARLSESLLSTWIRSAGLLCVAPPSASSHHKETFHITATPSHFEESVRPASCLWILTCETFRPFLEAVRYNKWQRHSFRLTSCDSVT